MAIVKKIEKVKIEKINSDGSNLDIKRVSFEGNFYHKEYFDFKTGNINRWIGKKVKINFLDKISKYFCQLTIYNQNPNNTYLKIGNNDISNIHFLKVGKNTIDFYTSNDYIEIEAEEIFLESNKELSYILHDIRINEHSVLDIDFEKSVKIGSKNIIKYIGQSGTCGYASAAKGYIADYVLRNVPISWQHLQFDDSKNDKNYYVDALCESVLDKKYDEYQRLIMHSTPDLWEKFIKENESISDIIGYCTWETNKLPDKWVNYINFVPEVWVPSNFNKECFINSGVKSKIKVVPHIWHKQILFNKSEVQIYDFVGNKLPNDKFTFYSIGELNFRKGIEDLVTVFDKFNEKFPDTQLLLKLHYKSYTSENIKYCVDKIKSLTNKLYTSVFLILDNLSNDDILALHSFGDCYVSLNKGEGFGLTIFDAYNLGKNVITTGYGGQIDYLGKDYKGLVDFKIENVSGMDKFSTNYTSDQEWAYPDLDHAYELMKNVL